MVDAATVLIILATFLLAGLRLAVPARGEIWIGPLAGAANGALSGMTGSFNHLKLLELARLG